MQDNDSAVEAIADLAIAGSNPKFPAGFLPFVLVPEGHTKVDLTPEWKEELPDYIIEKVNLAELESFIRYIKQFKTHTAQIFAVASDTGARFLAVLDYHEAGKESKPGRTDHEAVYAPSFSDDFKAWCGINGKPLSQTDFLDFLRKWGDTISSHSDADMIELASTLDFKIDAQFSSHVERTTGGRRLLFDEKIEGSGQMKQQSVTVPDSMRVKLPIFVGGREYEIPLDLLYRPHNGTLRIIVELKRPHRVVRQAVLDIIEDVHTGTEIEPFFGSL